MERMTIVYKIGTSSLTQESGHLDRIKIARITNQVAQLHQAGHQIILVTSGSIAAGFGRLGYDKRPSKIIEKQAAAAVGQGLLMEEYTQNLMRDGIVTAQLLLTREDFSDPRRYQNAAGALQVLLHRRAIPIINENDTVSIEEIKIGDNDTLSAQVAALVKADLLVLLTDVDGLYTANPRQDPTAQHIPLISEITPELMAMAGGSGSANGTGGMMTKLQAAILATKSGVPVFITSSQGDRALLEAAQLQSKGTLFTAQDHALNQKQQWLAFHAPVQAGLYIDEGAYQALVFHGSSLLYPGVVGLEGDFEAGQVIGVYREANRQLIGKGRVRFSSQQLMQADFVMDQGGLVIHRNDWVTL